MEVARADSEKIWVCFRRGIFVTVSSVSYTHLDVYKRQAIGCTGGRHRSVVIGEKIREYLESRGYMVIVEHRDIRLGEDRGDDS